MKIGRNANLTIIKRPVLNIRKGNKYVSTKWEVNKIISMNGITLNMSKETTEKLHEEFTRLYRVIKNDTDIKVILKKLDFHRCGDCGTINHRDNVSDSHFNISNKVVCHKCIV